MASRPATVIRVPVAALISLSLLLLPACRTGIRAEGERPSAEVSDDGRVPAAAFFRKPLLSHVHISPDGRHIAAVVSKDGREILVVRPTRGGPTRPLAAIERDKKQSSMRLRTVGWAGDEHLLVSVETPSAHSNWRVSARQTRLMVVTLEGGNARYLGEDWRYQEYFGSQDNIVSWLPDDPYHVLLNLWMPGQDGAGVRKLDVRNGNLATVARPRTGAMGWAADHLGRVRAGWGEPRRRSEVFLFARTSSDDRFEELLRWNPFEEKGFHFAGFSERSNVIYVRSDDWTGRAALYTYDLTTRKLGGAVFAHPEVDVGGLRHSRFDGRLLSIGYVTDRPRLHFVDRYAGRIQARLDEALPNRTNRFVSANRDESLFIVHSSSDTVPPHYSLYDQDAHRLSPLFVAYPDLEEVALAPMKAIQYTARDGLTIHAYLTLPVDAGDAPLPAIVLPHGGPWARDVWGWDPAVQFLASRGFAVLQPNFRGSTGYGTEFRERGYGAWGLAMQDDITDGALWLVDRGIADPDRIGIYGASYGGFAALYALVKEPDVFRAGASFAGVTDPLTLLRDDKAYWGLLDDMQQLVGHRRNDREALEAISPVRHADRIRAPVLVAHGTEDPRVHVRHAHAMVDALEDSGASVETLLYEGEVHGFLDERNEIDFYTRLAAFFERNLAPAAIPVAVEPRDSTGALRLPIPMAWRVSRTSKGSWQGS